MTRFTLKIESSNVAFEDDQELVRILHRLAQSISDGRSGLFMLFDINGNRCGTADYECEDNE